MSDFHKFAALIKAQFARMSDHELFVVDIDTESLWNNYLNAFPVGSNPIFRERTEHDCSCCRHFVRNIGNVVSLKNGVIRSVWDAEGIEYPYNAVSQVMRDLVRQAPIKNIFRTKEGGFGADYTVEFKGDETHKWYHFAGKVNERHQCDEVGSQMAQFESAAQVMRRGLDELTREALDTVQDLIHDNLLYRGAEHSDAVNAFCALKNAYDDVTTTPDKNLFIWQNLNNRAARFRNTVIGTLVTDLSDGVDVERAVKSFETKVAPANYKRPTALITPRMVEDAMKTIRDLELEPALERRFANIADVSVQDVLFVDNSVQARMKDGVEGLLMEAATTPKKSGKEEAIDIDTFMNTVLPRATSVDVLMTNAAARNLMSLTAPVHEDSGRLFKWGNDFAWSYDGNVTDTIKEKVKRAGGNVNAHLRVSLSWFNGDDLDIHVREPNGNNISYSNKSGKLDVDMNAGGAQTREPVENVSWQGRVPDGCYLVKVNQYAKRENSDVGFVLEVEIDGVLQTFKYEKPVKGNIECLRLHMAGNQLVKTEVVNVVAGSASQEKWGIQTEQFVPVDTIMKSPNYWGTNANGNKHWFFILQGCKNPEPVRGIYNEFLSPEFEKHRKVFEVLGAKTKCPVVQDQLSGVGFSSTRKDAVTVLVKGDSIQKTYKITF